MEPDSKNVGGRPRGFEKDLALEQAMRLFWRHGYDGVSLEQLTTAMGIAAPSLYAAFGNKAGLYRAALDRYGLLDLSVMQQANTLTEAVYELLTSAIDAITDPARERGCMVSSGLVAVHPAHQPLADATAARRAAVRDELREAIGRFVTGEQPSSLALYLSAVMTGLSVQARDGVPREDLARVVAEVVGGLASAYPPSFNSRIVNDHQ
jgi:AcrR family transcriptional regulator